MRSGVILVLVAALSLAALVAIQTFDLSPGKLIATGDSTASATSVSADELDALFEGSADPEIDAYLKALRTVFPEDHARLVASLKKRAEAGAETAELEAAANAEAVAIARSNQRWLPYADPKALTLFFEGQAKLLEFARAAFGDEACVEAARHGGAAINARVMRQPPDSPLLSAYLREVIASHRKLLFVMKEGREAGEHELAQPTIEDWRALAQTMRALGAGPEHFDALDNPEKPVEDTVLCKAALLKTQALAELAGEPGATLRPHVAKTMVGG